MAILAELQENQGKKEIGVARLILEPDRNSGEFAVVVADDYQKKGLGTKLMDMLIEIAEEKELSDIYGIILPENEGMLRLCEKMGFTLKRTEDEVVATLTLK